MNDEMNQIMQELMRAVGATSTDFVTELEGNSIAVVSMGEHATVGVREVAGNQAVTVVNKREAKLLADALAAYARS